MHFKILVTPLNMIFESLTPSLQLIFPFENVKKVNTGKRIREGCLTRFLILFRLTVVEKAKRNGDV